MSKTNSAKGKKANKLERDLIKYSAAAGAAVLGATSAHGKIVYTDIDPDAFLTPGGTESYNIDVGGETKFTIQCSTALSFYWFAAINHKTANALWVGNAGQTSGVVAFSEDVSVNTQAPWARAGFLTYNANLALYVQGPTHGGAPYIGVGSFLGTSGKYIGIRFQDQGNTHYGWIQVDVSTNVSSATVTGWAYNDTPDGAITTGMIPEPNALALLALGAAGIRGLRRIFML